MAVPHIAAEIAKQVAKEVASETFKEVAKETVKEVGKEIGTLLKETIGEEMCKELIDQVVSEVANELVAEALVGLDPELQMIAAAIMKSYANEAILSWTELEVKGDSNFVIGGETSDGTDIDAAYMGDVSVLIDMEPGEVVGQMFEKDADSRTIFMSEDFYDLPNDVSDNFKDELAANDIDLVIIEGQ
ncbi:MAG: hypothetical protein RBS36_03125 [Thiomicrospira sp.]|jgi:hypothetical protein|nr:hypothetical protein [Thiomicrospira sp.]